MSRPGLPCAAWIVHAEAIAGGIRAKDVSAGAAAANT